MRSNRVLAAVDSHTEGMPTRVITGGVGVIPGATMVERRRYFIDNLDDIRGEPAVDTDFVNESIIGSRFVGRLVDTTSVGELPAVVPTVTGRAWITGMGQYLLDPRDPFPKGFLL